MDPPNADDIPPRGIRRLATLTVGRYLPVGTDHRAIASGLLIVTLFGVIAKLVSAGKELVLAWRFGTSGALDAYLFIFNLYGVPVAIWAGALGGAFIPILVRMKATDPEASHNLQAEMNGVATAAGLVIGLATAAVVWLFVGSGSAGLTADVNDKALTMALVMWPIIPVLFMIQVGSAQLMSARVHLNTAYEALPAIALVFAVLAFDGTWGWNLVLGTIVGVVAQLLVTWRSVRTSRASIRIRFSMRSPAWRELWSGFRLLAIAYALQGGSAIVDQLLLARLGPGAISTYGYASRLLALLISLGGISIGRTILPILSSMQTGNLPALRRTTNIWVMVMFGAGTLVFVVFSLLASPIVRTVYQHGAFGANDSLQVIQVVSVLAQSVPFYFAMMVLMQGHLAVDGHAIILRLAVISLSIKLFLGIPMTLAYGLFGLCVTNVLMTASQFLYLGYTFGTFRFLRTLPNRRES